MQWRFHVQEILTMTDYLSLLDRPIAFHRAYRSIGGSIVAAVFLSQAVYWSNRLSDDRGGWFYKTQVEWEDETGLTRREQETARKGLKSAGILEEEKRGTPAKLWYRIDGDRVRELLESLGKPRTNKDGGKRQAGMSESAKQDRRKATNLHTEITTETTSEITDISTPSTEPPAQESPKPKPKSPTTVIFETWAEAAGIDSPYALVTKARQLAVAKRLAGQNVEPREVIQCMNWVMSTWNSPPSLVDLVLIEGQMDKWRAAQKSATQNRSQISGKPVQKKMDWEKTREERNQGIKPGEPKYEYPDGSWISRDGRHFIRDDMGVAVLATNKQVRIDAGEDV